MEKTAIALGTFDGVHLGHKAVLEAAVNSGIFAVAVAFEIPPKTYFSKEGIILTDKEEKTRLIKQTGIKKIDYLDFLKVKDISAKDFFDYLIKKYAPSLIVCGYNYSFGKGGQGNTELLEELCVKNGITLKVIDKVTLDGEAVSSTHIRNLIKDGNVKKAALLSGQPFSISAQVIHGDERGRKIDFPTVNQLLEKDIATVKFGVYMSKAIIDSKEYYGMTNIGLRPTYPAHSPIMETHFFDFHGNLYDKTLRIELLDFLREEKKFSCLNELKEAITKDKEKIKKLISGEE
ncbi:MAG: riboflavin biosynthesis protein RibF [Acutalibacteraceae bacterium]|nr:riboflavin biosynthesis protein RibF [Acutalibacteraceae bacterium]